MRLLGTLIGKGKAQPSDVAHGPSSLPAPQQPVFVVGDVHGRADLLEQVLELIDREIGAYRLKDPKLVFVGNLLDHGPASAQVIARMRELTAEFPANVICLLGNHEQMLLDFLEAPVARHSRWLKDGASATFASYGLEIGGGTIDRTNAEEAAAALHNAMGDDAIAWLGARPLMVSSGTLHVVHAAADPRRPLDDQTARVLTWGHPEFLGVARGDGQWVAHGHAAFDHPHLKDSRISVNTDAWQSGVLSAAMILPSGQVGFVQTAAGTA